MSTWQAIRATAAEVEARAERDRALKAEAQARAEADKAKAINDFLTEDLLPRPSRRTTRPRTRSRSWRCSTGRRTRWASGSRSQPEVEEALRRTIAGTYHGLASWEKAERQWRAVARVGAALGRPRLRRVLQC